MSESSEHPDRKLRSWYLAKLRRAALSEESAQATPMSLVRADSRSITSLVEQAVNPAHSGPTTDRDSGRELVINLAMSLACGSLAALLVAFVP